MASPSKKPWRVVMLTALSFPREHSKPLVFRFIVLVNPYNCSVELFPCSRIRGHHAYVLMFLCYLFTRLQQAIALDVSYPVNMHSR